MATLRRYFTKKMTKDIDKNLDSKYSVSEDLARQVSATPGTDGNTETGERRRMRSVSISRSGRFKQKKRERGALQDRPDLYQTPSQQDPADDSATGQTATSNYNFAKRVPSGTDKVDLYQSRNDLVNESSTDDGLHESSNATYKQTIGSNSNNNNNSISRIVRPSYKGPAETGGRLTKTLV